MTATPLNQPPQSKKNPPKLLFFTHHRSGIARRVDGFLCHEIQKAGNHDTFDLYFVDVDENPSYARQMKVTQVPEIVVVDDGLVAARTGGNLRPQQIRETLEPWLRCA